jgi:hemoglobin
MNASPLTVVHAANPHFGRLGGEPAVRALVDAFYRAMDTRADAAAIRAMHDDDLAATRAVLVDYLCEWMGGPKRYTAMRGAPALRRRHLRFSLDASAADAWLACMRDALAATCADAPLRDELLAAFSKIATHLAAPSPSPHPPTLTRTPP